VAVLAALLPGCWLQVGFDPGHTRHNDVEDELTAANAASLAEAWTVALGPGAGEPMIRGDRAYVTTGGFDPATGESFIAARAYAAATGSEAWQRGFASFCCASPSIDYPAPAFVDNQLWAGYFLLYSGPRPVGGFGGPVRLDPVDGRQIGREENIAMTPPVESGGRVVQQTMGTDLIPELVVRDSRTLAAQWQATIPPPSTPEPFAGPPAVVDGRIVVAHGAAVTGYPLAGCGGAVCPPAWTRDDLGEPTAVAAQPGRGEALVATGDELVALSPTTGLTLWRAPLGAGASGLAIAGDTVFVGAAATLRAFPAGGCGAAICEPTWTAALGTSASSAPTVAGGVVYVGGAGIVEAFAVDGCGTATATCPSLAGVPVDGTVHHVVVADGRLFTINRSAGAPSHLTAFAPSP
jgi:outer membrane protein assembly factor BamB